MGRGRDQLLKGGGQGGLRRRKFYSKQKAMNEVDWARCRLWGGWERG